MLRSTRIFALATLWSLFFAARSAPAETIAQSGGNVSERFINGSSVGFGTGPTNLNPAGISF